MLKNKEKNTIKIRKDNKTDRGSKTERKIPLF